MCELQFERYVSQKPPGDRATRTVTCSRFVIKIGKFEAAVFDQFDGFMTHVNDYGDTYKGARKYTDDLADVLDVQRPRLVDMIEKKVEKVTWIKKKVEDERIEP